MSSFAAGSSVPWHGAISGSVAIAAPIFREDGIVAAGGTAQPTPGPLDPARVHTSCVVLPALLANYFGQGALILRDPASAINPFYLLAPSALQYPLISLATVAAIIASQAVISGAFSLTRAAIQMGYCPRLTIEHLEDPRA